MQEANAAQELRIDTTVLLRSTLSSRHHNRISFENKRIRKVFYPEGAILIRIEEDSGQIFVQALIDQPPVTTISLVTNDGIIQDLELSFSDKSSEILILKESKGECCQEGVTICSYCVFQDKQMRIQDVVDQVLAGYAPEEYLSMDDNGDSFCIKKGIILRRSSVLIGPLDTVYIMTVENRSYRCQRLQECELNVLGGEWVYLDKPILNSGEKALVMIGVSNDE